MDDNTGFYNKIFTPEMKVFMEQQEKLQYERQKTIKHGKNVIHLNYIGELDSIEIQEVTDILSNGGLEFSRYDKSGIVTITANFEHFNFDTFIVINTQLIIDILKGISSNIIWDTIKLSTIKIWEILHLKKNNKISGSKIERRDVTFGIKVHLDKNTGFDLELKGNFTKEERAESLDKILDFLKEQPLRENYQNSDYVYYDNNIKQWLKIDVKEELGKIVIEKASKHKSQQDNSETL